MPDSYTVKEARVQEALEAIPEGSKPNITRLAQEFHVPYQQLLNRYKGLNARKSNNYALTEPEEAAVHQYIQRLDALGTACRRPMLLRAANSVLRKRPGPQRTVGKHWPTRFVQRFPQYKIRQQKPLAAQRKNAYKPEEVLDWYHRFDGVCKEIGVAHSDTYNMDETGFRVGVGKSQWVITEEWNRPLFQTDADNRDYITSVECISGTGYTLPPMLIMAGK